MEQLDRWFGQRGRQRLQSRLRKGAMGVGVTLFLLMAFAGVAAAASFGQTTEPQPGTSVWPVLLPILAAAASVERTIELGWNYIEWALMRFLGWRPSDLKTPSYIELKSGTSLVAGLFLGIIVSNYSGMRLLEYLRPLVPGFLDNIPALWDIIITGIVIGAGSKPAHDILGIITQLKNFTGGSALKQREQAGAALADGILKLGQAETPAYNIDVPGVGPTPSGSARAARSRMVEDTGRGTRERTIEKYAKAIHDNLYINS